MKIAFLASEVIPFAKTGGLADVAGALPKYLVSQGADVCLLMPFYREVKKKNLPLRRPLEALDFDWAGARGSASILEYASGPFPVYFIEKNVYFDRDELYGTAAGDYPDNGERFGFFARAALEAMRAMGFRPDLIHGHDWQAATAFADLKFVYGGDPFFSRIRSLFTIHNLAYQGLFEKEILAKIGLPDSLFNMDDLEFYGKVNFLKAGILYASAVSTVSPRYAKEIQTQEFGCGLDGLLRSRANVLHGILNGVDYTDWNPATDRLIPANFRANDLAGKAACKARLLGMFGLSAEEGYPLIGMVTRLAGQKGLDLVCEALEKILGLGANLVILGTGDEKIQRFLGEAQKRYPSRFGLKIAFDERIAHSIYAGSDVFLIPSRYEPCGLTQMYSLRYGTVPVVRATGGLDDSIQGFDAATRTGNGFKFEEASPEALTACLRTALRLFQDKDLWRSLVLNAMSCDFSWEKSAARYSDLYRKIIQGP